MQPSEVSMDFMANGLLALGAHPAMVHSVEELDVAAQLRAAPPALLCRGSWQVTGMAMSYFWRVIAATLSRIVIMIIMIHDGNPQWPLITCP